MYCSCCNGRGLGGGLGLNIPYAPAKQAVQTEHHQAILYYPTETEVERASHFFDLGMLKALEGDYQGAIYHYNQAIRIETKNAAIYYNRGVALYSIGQADAALQDFNQAILLDPTHADAYGNRGALRLEQHDRQGAFQDFEQAAKLFTQQGDTSSAQALQNWMQQHLSCPQP